MPLGAADGLHLLPAEPGAAARWQRRVNSAGSRPAPDGLAASSLGGAARSERDWVRRCLDLRAAGRRGGTYAYLLEQRGLLVGEALGFVDGGTRAAELTVWLAPAAQTPELFADAVDALTSHILAAPDRPDRVRVTVTRDDTAAALLGVGFVREGVLRDPPRADRIVLVAHSGSRSSVQAVS